MSGTVIEEIIELNQKKNRPHRSDVIGLSLNVPMPPPDYFTKENRDKFNFEEVQNVD